MMPFTRQKIVVRNCDSKDLADVREILYQYESPTGRIWDEDKVEAFLSDVLREEPDGVFVAEINGKVVGFAVVMYRDWQNIAYLDYIQVKTSYMNKGIGHSLMEKCIKWSETRSARIIYTETGKNNERAIKFYKKHGFQITGHIPEYYREDSDATILVKKLGQR